MTTDFGNIHDHIIPMENFSLRGLFGDLPEVHLDQLKPLDKTAAAFLWNYISDSGLHDDVPFKDDFFQTIDKAKITGNNEKLIRKWLYRRGLPFNKPVFLSGQPTEAMIVPWKLFVKYFDCFYHSDDLTVIDQSLAWALLFYHEDEIYFGTNNPYTAGDDFAGYPFTW